MNAAKPAWKRVARDFLPPGIVRLIEQRICGVRYRGDYPDWQAACRASRGYEAPEILERVARAARSARDGRVAFERDGVEFVEPAYNWPVLTCLLGAASQAGGRLSMVDFGGSLGSLYFQHRALLRGLHEVCWSVVEQSSFVELGRREFANNELRFDSTITAASSAISPTLILFSGVLAWVHEPAQFIAEALMSGTENIVIARTPVVAVSRDRICVQVNSPGLGGGSYPCRIFSRSPLVAKFEALYQLAAEWEEPDQVEGGITFRGFWFRRKSG